MLLLGLLLLICIAGIQSQDTTEFSSHFGGVNHQEYISWLSTRARYSESLYLPADGDQGAAVHWTIDGDTIRLAVVARAQGWIGLGFSENGGMDGADLMIYEASSDRIIDAYVMDAFVPLIDDCQSWTLEYSERGEHMIIMEASRLLDPQDTQDRALRYDADYEIPISKVIAAWGDGETYGYHGPNVVRGGVRWHSVGNEEEAYVEQEIAQFAEGSFEVRAKDRRIRERETEYVDFCLTWDEIQEQGLPNQPASVIAFEPIIDQLRHVHHFTVHGFVGEDCTSFGLDFRGELMYAWGPGEPSFVLPRNLGAPVGPGSFKSLNLEIHYDNPQLIKGLRDNSGVRFHFTTAVRPMEIGMLEIGDPYLALSRRSVGNGLTQYTFDCDGSCSGIVLNEPITILREYLHMHAVGAAASNELVRDGTVVHKSKIEFFNFQQQGNQAVQQMPFQVEPGDGFRMTCTYDTNEDTVFGRASQQEMCIAFIMYYPRRNIGLPWTCGAGIPVPACEALYESESLSSIPRTFGTPMSTCPTVATTMPTVQPTSAPTGSPVQPTGQSTSGPTSIPTLTQSMNPTLYPIVMTSVPTNTPVVSTQQPTSGPTSIPTQFVPIDVTLSPTQSPSTSLINPELPSAATFEPSGGIEESLTPTLEPVASERASTTEPSSTLPRDSDFEQANSSAQLGFGFLWNLLTALI